MSSVVSKMRSWLKERPYAVSKPVPFACYKSAPSLQKHLLDIFIYLLMNIGHYFMVFEAPVMHKYFSLFHQIKN